MSVKGQVVRNQQTPLLIVIALACALIAALALAGAAGYALRPVTLPQAAATPLPTNLPVATQEPCVWVDSHKEC
jgi:hypothetical protein